MTTEMLARDVMTKRVFCARRNEDFNFVEIMSEWKHVRHVPVVDEEEKLVGMLSIRDLLRHIGKPESSRFEKIASIMSAPPVSASPQTPVKQIVQKMMNEDVSAVPIVDDGRVVGIITERDLVGILGQRL